MRIKVGRFSTLFPGACLAFLVILLLSDGAAAQENSVCIECHGKADIKSESGEEARSLHVDEEILSTSVHEGFECIDCHMDLEDQEFPHEVAVEPVDCSECHEDEAEVYEGSLHGQALDKEDPLAPTCAACHGKHDILPSSHPESHTTFINIPSLCGSCHKEGAPVQEARHVPQDHVLKNYSQSIHGEGLFKQGLAVTAVCTSCHTAHLVLAHDDPASTIHRDNVVDTCMQCHILIEEVHRQVIKGELWEKEPHNVPVCVECHSPHKIRKVYYEEGMADEECLACHGDENLIRTRGGQTQSLFVDAGKASNSMHSGVACAQCHTGGTPASTGYRPCSTMAEKVDCSICHAEAVEQHEKSIHGKLARRRDLEAPECNDCHEPHYTLGKQEPTSPTFPTHVPELCGRCHREGAPVEARHTSVEQEIISHYTMSIHGKGLLKSGLLVTAVCTDCHTTHMALPASDPESSVHQDRVAATCAQCHHGIYEEFVKSIHANGSMKEGHSTPTCSDCHSSHSISRTDVGGFKVGIIEKCGRCHEEVMETYFETFHGKVSKLGEDATAKCYHCHGAHDVLPVTDPRSRLSRENIVGTCQQCHEGAHRRFAGYLTHATHHNRLKYPFLFYAFWGMTVLLVMTLGVAGLHTGLWLWRGLRTRRERPVRETGTGGKYVRRLTAYQRWLHFVMLLSFFGLAISGMTIKFSYMKWAQVLSSLLGGFESAGYIHRICAIATFGYFAAHIYDVYRRIRKDDRGFKILFDASTTMLPTRRDWREAVATWKWFIGKGEYPSYGRWTYWEKFDYFAVFWGVAIIGSTGLMLWFPELFTRVFPGWFINVATIIHSDEALLAVGFIFTVHFFNTHFRPGKFPMDPVMFTGSLPLEEFKTERPKEHDELVAAGKLEELLVQPKGPEYLRMVRIFGFCALALGISLVLLILYAMLFGYK
jgi:cytochrome b subunit of formate dehydrogenase